MVDVETGRQLLGYEEWKERAEAAEARAVRAEALAAAESAARREAEERAQALAEELERLRQGG